MPFDSAETRFQRMLRDELEKELEDKQAEVALGSCPDFSTYKERCGYIRALKNALEIADDLAERFNRD